MAHAGGRKPVEVAAKINEKIGDVIAFRAGYWLARDGFSFDEAWKQYVKDKEREEKIRSGEST